MLTIRRLGPDDAEVLRVLALDDVDFDLAERGDVKEPLTADAAHGYLTDPSVLHWVAEEGGDVVGHLQGQRVRKRCGDPVELLLYEIGVRERARRRGVGTALMNTMVAWMVANGVREVWVLADNTGAREFYVACGFTVAEDQPVYLVRQLA
jgi:ribosomal protein S18 acetylase RimI-like enzyme